ncbi:hypothetical protein ACE1TI_08920 [Alteribacillus sp. JSM 102045]|uniref:hypothetical protein n=1 Tax=Alteribacillus sp. JSM 102045 TaxID=1562101 RepID=UPI0035C0DFCF
MGIPKPLVQLNQIFIVLSVALTLLWNEVILFVPFFIGLYTIITKQNPIILMGKIFLAKPIPSNPQGWEK